MTAEEQAEMIVAAYERKFDSTLDMSPALLRKLLVDCIAANLREYAVELAEIRRILDDEMLEPLGREAIVRERAALLVHLASGDSLTTMEVARCEMLELNRLAIDCKAMQKDLDAVALALAAVARNRDSAVRYSTIDALAALLPHELATESLKKLSEDAFSAIAKTAREALDKFSSENR